MQMGMVACFPKENQGLSEMQTVPAHVWSLNFLRSWRCTLLPAGLRDPEEAFLWGLWISKYQKGYVPLRLEPRKSKAHAALDVQGRPVDVGIDSEAKLPGFRSHSYLLQIL